MRSFAAIVLAGGGARRLGGVDKTGLPIGGRPMRDRVLDAVADAAPRILVGPTAPVPDGVRLTREDPPGGGPVAAAAAGLTLVDRLLPRDRLALDPGDKRPGAATVALLAADLPLLTRPAVGELRHRLGDTAVDGVCYLDAQGRRQTLCGVWRIDSLRAAVERVRTERGGTLAGAAIRELLVGLDVLAVPWSGTGPPPWFDCDTDDDVRRAEEWVR